MCEVSVYANAYIPGDAIEGNVGAKTQSVLVCVYVCVCWIVACYA